MLTPDFLRKDGALETVVAARPDVFNHNLETVPSLYLDGAAGRALFPFAAAACSGSRRSIPAMFTKSGIMVGLGETRNEVLQVMDDLRAADVDFLTIGQYLQPTRKHHPVDRFVPPDEFKASGDDRLCQGLPDGLGIAADALLASRRRGFRAAARGAADAAPEPCRNIPTKRRVRHSAAEMFDLVADVEHYPRIRAAVPLARGARADQGRRQGIIVADMTVAYKLVARNLHQPGDARPPETCKSWSNISKDRFSR